MPDVIEAAPMAVKKKKKKKIRSIKDLRDASKEADEMAAIANDTTGDY